MHNIRAANKLFSNLLNAHPDMWWLRRESNPDILSDSNDTRSTNYQCLFSPDYHGNSYQNNLYRLSQEHGFRCSAINADKVVDFIHGSDASELPGVFHQHWLREIFRGKTTDTKGLASVQSYFNALRYLQSKGGKVIWTVHNLFGHDISESERVLNLVCMKEIAGLADVILVHSPNSVSELEKLIGFGLKGRTKLLKHSLYDSMLSFPKFLPIELRLKKLPPGLKFLMFGMMRPYKGGSDLLKEFLSLTTSGELKDATLILAGKIYDPPLKKLIQDNKDLLDQVVVIDRRLSDTELTSLCREADVGVLPYRKILISGSYYQAVTFGLPCIVPDIGMFQGEVEDGVTGIKYGPSGGLRKALQRAQSLRREGLEAIGRQTFTACRSQSERVISKQFCDLLESYVGLPVLEGSGQKIVKTTADTLADDSIKLSFCIPVMNRLDDLKATLAKNLEDNRVSKGRVEFVVVCFDQDDDVENWIKSEFKAELKEEYLRFYRSEPLDFWHFGIAKSAFKDLIRGKIYASLDGDNFTGLHGGEHIIEVFEEHDYKCIFHQFQGEWGDGTCGRVSQSREDYLDFGYDEHFLPRQWDEMDAMLSVLVQRPDRTYVCYEGKSIIDKSHPFKRYLQDHEYFPPKTELNPETDPLYASIGDKSFGAHDNNYVRDDLTLRYLSIFNHLQSYFKNSNRDDLKVQYVNELVEVQRQLIDEVDPKKLEHWVLHSETELPPKLADSDIVVLACIKNELDLPTWYQHYKRLGVTRFLIVDDGSDVPVKEILSFPDVHVWKPTVGQFRYAKVLWLEILLASYCNGLWCLTIDGDEYLSLPELEELAENDKSLLRRCVTVAEDSDQEYFCGFLLDMVPGPEEAISDQMGRESFSYYQYSPDEPGNEYRDHNTVRWSYGDKLDWAHSIDVRYKINGSLDSLRKFPIIKYREGMHLNQGFHDLIIEDVKRSPDDLIRSDLIPIVHYKLWVLSRTKEFEASKSFDAYHHETSENLKSLISGLGEKFSAATNDQCIYPYLGFDLMPTPSCQTIEIVLKNGNDVSSDKHSLQRQRSFVFKEGCEQVRLNGQYIRGLSSQSTIDWIRKMTPFSEVLEKSNDVVILATRSRGTRSE